MTPWSVSASAGIPSSAALSTMASIRLALLRSENSVWLWRWTKLSGARGIALAGVAGSPTGIVGLRPGLRATKHRGGSSAGLLGSALQQGHALHVVGVRKHVDDRRPPHPIAAAHEERDVPGLGRRLAADVDHPFGTQPQQLGDRPGFAPGSRRVEHDRLVVAHPYLAQRLLHAPGQHPQI